VDAALLEHRTDDAFLLLGQGDEEMKREDDLASVLFRNGLALLDGFLRFLGQFIETKHLGPL